MNKKLSLIVVLLLTFFLAACSSKEGATSTTSTANSKDTKEKVQKIIVGTGTQFPNICFIDENGKLTGYDVELVREIDKKLPEYEFEFKTMEFSNLLLSLETKKIDFIAHQMEVNEERKAKFLFNKEPYNIFPLKVVVRKDNNDIKSIKDLKGKKVIVTATSNAAVFLEKYNKEHNAGIHIVYAGQGADDVTNQIRTGRADATISTPFAVDFLNKAADAQQKVVGETLLDSKVYFLFRKDETKLQKRIDEALVELKKEGVVRELSKKWLGADYTVEF
ncbi:amino acid ABC transporter substrate-binding protein [Parageobacillus thermoglucosidasius]|uniref:L-cystine-binding protein TcyJ n=2 Tax=Anoxybacillaceae TaxID=3120669 RepID=A0AAN0YRC6_PARTM|nr:amino acid ABC transporter substrate-binding protein [Parageobacillus thermoglucosidasius]ALF09425.1 L-cystine-binding protein TcyJ [Parageobacillus thermoglucosidasius]ANZ29508.1 L-cystine-binding protein TcyJ [Parageobacillus thermoglucosidasius]APM80246.1 L-cystine-binding protein TcyJ [Parageobacillus thermoglucosidasius]KJX70213.1 L-cystine-binding protein TcyJ [Parageobacillus thermoglucosidasius]RDE20821.1 amino acid ABC transporter substrate-binding protein [Parageobacillus thermogl